MRHQLQRLVVPYLVPVLLRRRLEAVSLERPHLHQALSLGHPCLPQHRLDSVSEVHQVSFFRTDLFRVDSCFGLFISSHDFDVAPAFGSAPAASSLFAPAPAPGFGFHPTATPQIPAQAAMQAHLDASARQEAAKLQAALETLNAAYTGAPSADSKHKFVAIFFDDISLEQRQMQLLMGGQRPPKSPHVSEKEWLDAIVRNPDPEQYMPVAYVGAEALQTRIARAQDKSNTFSKGVETLHLTRETLARNCTRAQSDLRGLSRQHATLRTKLLEVMSKVELARNMNLPRQVDEEKMNQRLVAALHQVNQIQTLVAMAQSKAKSQSHSRPALVVNVPDERELARVLTGHRESLTSMVKVMEKDTRDVNLLKQHLASNVPLPPR